MTGKTIGDQIDRFISYKHSLGYVYDTQERYLRHYQKHMEEAFPHLESCWQRMFTFLKNI